MDVDITCPRCAAPRSSIVRDGSYFRADDSKFIQRYQCKPCRKKFSSATLKPTYRQRKRRINSTVRYCFGSNMCPRDMAELVGVNIKTIHARLKWQAKLSREKNRRYLQAYIKVHGPIRKVQFDDLVTFEHTKCKPLSVPMAVVDGTRIPLGFRVGAIPASGPLAAISRKKYGKRDDECREKRRELFEELSALVAPDVVFKTDGHEHYGRLIRQYFPNAEHSVHISHRGSIVGQGELKKIGFDPLFSINHTFATARAKVNRLNRRTWCTTKSPARLADHLDIFIDVFCERLKLLPVSTSTLQRQVARDWVGLMQAAA